MKRRKTGRFRGGVWASALAVRRSGGRVADEDRLVNSVVSFVRDKAKTRAWEAFTATDLLRCPCLNTSDRPNVERRHAFCYLVFAICYSGASFRQVLAEMSPTEQLIQNNRAWSERMTSDAPDYFRKLAEQQSPKYLWIGCADSRIPANEVVGLMPGELFVHRNVANLIYPSDPNCLSVVAYAVAVLKVEHIIVCGHYGCGGVKAAMSNESFGAIDNWLSKIKEVHFRYHEHLDPIADMEERVNRLCELNVVEQVNTLSRTVVIQDAWHRGQPLILHGWIYGLKDGLIKDLGIRVERLEQVPPQFRFQLAG